MAPETLARISEGTLPKGDVLATARLAGIQAAKRTDEWITLCHSLPLDAVEIGLVPDPEGSRVFIQARARAHWRTNGGTSLTSKWPRRSCAATPCSRYSCSCL